MATVSDMMVANFSKRQAERLEQIAQETHVLLKQGGFAVASNEEWLAQYMIKKRRAALTTQEMAFVLRRLEELYQEEVRVVGAIATINVVRCADVTRIKFDRMVSFPTTREGRDKAELTFSEWVREAEQPTPVSDDEVREYIDDGVFEFGKGFIALLESE